MYLRRDSIFRRPWLGFEKHRSRAIPLCKLSHHTTPVPNSSTASSDFHLCLRATTTTSVHTKLYQVSYTEYLSTCQARLFCVFVLPAPPSVTCSMNICHLDRRGTFCSLHHLSKRSWGAQLHSNGPGLLLCPCTRFCFPSSFGALLCQKFGNIFYVWSLMRIVLETPRIQYQSLDVEIILVCYRRSHG